MTANAVTCRLTSQATLCGNKSLRLLVDGRSGSSGFPLRAFWLDHPWALRDRGCRRRSLVVHRQHSQTEPRRDLSLHQVRPAVGRRHRRLVHQRSGRRGQQQGDAVCGRRNIPLIDAWKMFHGYPAQIPPIPSPLGACLLHKRQNWFRVVRDPPGTMPSPRGRTSPQDAAARFNPGLLYGESDGSRTHHLMCLRRRRRTGPSPTTAADDTECRSSQ
jgi:hypothetical protein